MQPCKIFNFLTSLMVLTLILPAKAYGNIVFDPTNFIENSTTAANSVISLNHQAEQIRIALENMKNYDGNAGEWGNAQTLLKNLSDTVAQGQSLSYSMQNIDEAFKQRFPGYQPSKNYPEDYKTWAQTALDTLQQTLGAAGLQTSNFVSEQAALNQLAQLSQTAVGRMQALQVGNMIATQQVTQLQQLRQLIASQVSAQNAYAAYQVNKEANQESATSAWIDAGDITVPKYGTKGKGFGANDFRKIP